MMSEFCFGLSRSFTNQTSPKEPLPTRFTLEYRATSETF